MVFSSWSCSSVFASLRVFMAPGSPRGPPHPALSMLGLPRRTAGSTVPRISAHCDRRQGSRCPGNPGIPAHPHEATPCRWPDSGLSPGHEPCGCSLLRSAAPVKAAFFSREVTRVAWPCSPHQRPGSFPTPPHPQATLLEPPKTSHLSLPMRLPFSYLPPQVQTPHPVTGSRGPQPWPSLPHSPCPAFLSTSSSLGDS